VFFSAVALSLISTPSPTLCLFSPFCGCFLYFFLDNESLVANVGLVWKWCSGPHIHVGSGLTVTGIYADVR
jgi:hypothetical protein